MTKREGPIERDRRSLLREVALRALAATALGWLIAFATSVHAQDPLSFRREYVPRLDVDAVAVGLVPIPRDKFEETVATLRREATATRPPSDRLESATWIGVYDGERVVGWARWTPPKVAPANPPAPEVASEDDESSPAAIVRLGATNVFLDPDVPAELDALLPKDARTFLSADPEAVLALESGGAVRAELFVRADGSFGADLPRAAPARLAWAAGTSPGEGGVRTAEWRLPTTLRTTLWLVVPAGTEVVADSDWLSERVEPDVAPQESDDDAAATWIYRLEGRPADDRPLRLSFATAPPTAAGEALYRVANRYEFSERGLDLTYEISIDPTASPRSIRFRLPVGVAPIELRRGERRIEFSVDRPSPQADGRAGVVRVAELPEEGASAPLILRAISMPGRSEGDPLPQLRLEDAAWAGETTAVVATSPLEVQGAFGKDCVAVSPNADDGEGTCRFRHRTEESTIVARVGRAPSRLTLDSVLSLRAGRSSLEATLDAEATPVEGTAFERELRLLRPWSLDRVDVEPAGALLDWSIESRDERSQTIRLRFRDGREPGEAVRLRCEAHLRVDDPGQTWSGETLRAFEFEGDVQERRVIALFDDASVRFRPVRFSDWRTLADDDLTPAQRATLGESQPGSLLADDSTFRGAQFAFETGERRHAVRSRTFLERSGSTVVGSVRVAVEPLAGPLERLRVRFSEPLPPGARWAPSGDATWTFEADRIASGESNFDGEETWELVFARPMTKPFEVVASYEALEEGALVAPLASAPSASTQSGRLSIAADLLEDRELVGEGIDRMPAGEDRDESGAVVPVLRFRYEPTRRHRASLIHAAHRPRATIVDGAPARLDTETSSAGAFHILTYRVAASSRSEPLALMVPAGARIDEIRLSDAGREAVVRPGAIAGETIPLPAMASLEAIEIRFHQPLPDFALWSDLVVPLPRVEGMPPGAVRWTVRSHGAIQCRVDAPGWTASDASTGPTDDQSERRTTTISASPDAALRVTVYRDGAILQAAWIAFFLAAALVWALASRFPVAAAVAIAAVAVATAFIPEPAEPLRWGALYGSAAGFACAWLFRRAGAAAPIHDESQIHRGAAQAAATATFLALAMSGALAAYGQPAPNGESRTYRVVIPTDDEGKPTGSYYYAPREFYDRFLALQRSLERPKEEWRIVSANYEGTMTPGLIDETPRLSELLLHVEIETFAENVTATVPLNRKFAEFAGMMEGAADGGMEVRWNEAGDALSLTFEEPGPRELRIPFYPAPDPALPPGSRKTTILPMPSAKLYVRGEPEALDDLAVTGSLGGGQRRVARDLVEYDLGPTTEIVFGSRRIASGAAGDPAVQWGAGMRIVGDPEACRIEAVIAGEAPLGVAIQDVEFGISPDWIVATDAVPGAIERVEAIESDGKGRRYRYVFGEPQTGPIRATVTLTPAGSPEAGAFRTPQFEIDGVAPTSVHAAFVPAESATCDWAADAPGAGATFRSVPKELGLLATDLGARTLPSDGAATFWIRDPAATPTYALHTEFILAESELRARYALALAKAVDPWLTIDLPETAEIGSVDDVSGEGRTPLVWRRDGRRLFVKTDASADADESSIEIQATIRRVGDAPLRLPVPRLGGAAIAEADLRVYREPGLDASIEGNEDWVVDPSFAPGAFEPGKGRAVGAFLLSPDVSRTTPSPDRPNPPTLRTRNVAEAIGSVWTSVVPTEQGFALRLAIDLDERSGQVDRLAVEAPADLGDPVALSPPGSVTVRTPADAERRYWIYVPDRPLAPGTSISIQAPLTNATPERLVVSPVRPLNLRATERHVLLPERLGDRPVEWAVVRLQAATTTERIAAQADPALGSALAFEAPDDRYEARVRRLDAATSSGSTPSWVERRVRFDAPGQYRATVAWDFPPQEASKLRIVMPPGTTTASLEIDGVSTNWRTVEDRIETTSLPSALPFRLTLSYRGEFDAAASGEATLSLPSPTIAGRAGRGEAWIVESADAAPWQVDEEAVGAAAVLDYARARLDAFEATFSAGALSAEDCTPAEAAAFASQRLSDLRRLRTAVQATGAVTARRDETLARIDAIAETYAAAAGAAASASPVVAVAIDEPARPLAIRVAAGEELRAIEIPLAIQSPPARIPWRRLVETFAIVAICLGLARFGGRFVRWFEQMPLPVGTLATILFATLFLPSAWLAPTIVLGFLALVAFVNRRWLSHRLPGMRGPGISPR